MHALMCVHTVHSCNHDCVHACSCEYTDDSWLLSIMNEVLNVFLSRVPLMGERWGNTVHTHSSPPTSTNNAQSNTHVPLIGPVSPALPQQTFLFSPVREPLVGLLCLLTLQALTWLFSPCDHAAWLWAAQKLESFCTQTEGLWLGWAGEWSPGQRKRPSPSQLSQGDFQKTPGTQGRFVK